MHAKLTGIAVAATSAVLVAGCGGGSKQMSKAAYEAKIQADGKAVQDAVNQISASFSSIKTVAKEVAAYHDYLGERVGSLLDPAVFVALSAVVRRRRSLTFITAIPN